MMAWDRWSTHEEPDDVIILVNGDWSGVPSSQATDGSAGTRCLWTPRTTVAETWWKFEPKLNIARCRIQVGILQHIGA